MVWWINCPTCPSRQRVATRQGWTGAGWQQRRAQVPDLHLPVSLKDSITGKRMEVRTGTCGTCGAEGFAIFIDLTGGFNQGNEGERCNGHCLNGKFSCSCRCMGMCHGAGSCACGDLERVAAYRAAMVEVA